MYLYVLLLEGSCLYILLRPVVIYTSNYPPVELSIFLHTL